MKSAVLIYSGGMDSTVLLYWLRKEGITVRTLSIDYGQRHRVELLAAKSIAQKLDVEHRIIDLSPVRELMQGSSQTDSSVPVPEGHYAEESMKQTVVPNRNMILLAVAGAWAISTKSDHVAYAAHAGDHAIYPDCRTEFAEAMRKALELADWHKCSLVMPFIDKTKADIVGIGTRLGVPFEQTWSCYKGGKVHCGKCGTCVERRESFQLAEVNDPTTYLP